MNIEENIFLPIDMFRRACYLSSNLRTYNRNTAKFSILLKNRNSLLVRTVATSTRSEENNDREINMEISNDDLTIKILDLVKLFEEKNSKGEEEKAKSEQRLGEAELKTKSWLHKHSPDHVQPAALQDKLDQEQRENELDQHRGVAEHEAELRGEVKLVQLRAEQGFPLKQESPEGKGRKCETAEMV